MGGEKSNNPSTSSGGDPQKAGDYWAAHESDFQTKRHWTEIPAVKERINLKTTGNPDTDIFEYALRKYFLNRGIELESCLSLGCGAGELERGLSKYVVPRRHDALDASEGLIAKARERAIPFSHIQYRVADLNHCTLPEREYDLILAHQSLHHIMNLQGLFEQLKKAMKPQAIFLFDEYIGPSRFQWSDRQLQAINGVMGMLPAWLTVDLVDGHQRREVVRNTPEQVAAVDPSEAIRSSEIVFVAERYFKIIEFLPYGGTILHMLLHSIAGNFLREEARPWLDLLFRVEDLLLPELGNDFAAAICIIPEK